MLFRLCLTKLYTLDDLSDDFNTTCLNSAKLLVVTPAAPAAAATPTVAVIATQARSSPQPPLIPVTVVKQPDGPVVALNQDETTTVVSSTTVFETTPLQTTEEFETEESSLKITQDTSKKPTAPSLLGQKTTTKSRALTTEDTDDITSNKPVQTSKSSLGKTLTSKSATTNRVSTSDTDRLSTSTVDKLSTSAAEKLSTSGANRLSSARGTTETEGLSRGAQTTKNLLKTTGDSSDSTGSSSTGTVNAAINNKKVSVDDTTDSSKTSKRLATALTSSLGTTAK